MFTVTHLDAQKRFSPVEYPYWLLAVASSCISHLVSHESCMMLKKSIHVGKKAAYLKFNSNLIHSTDLLFEMILTTINFS